MSDAPQPGLVGWVDLTVDNAPEIRDFYRAVMGWEYREVQMDEGYADYSMTTMEGQDVTGICHARGPNEGLPAQWLVYFTVADLDLAISEVRARGGALLRAPFEMDAGRYAVIRDPAGAVCALFQGKG
jgi:predicted enzyme related to lactoylglutathione lyase